jgi:hypothetical protein
MKNTNWSIICDIDGFTLISLTFQTAPLARLTKHTAAHNHYSDYCKLKLTCHVLLASLPSIWFWSIAAKSRHLSWPHSHTHTWHQALLGLAEDLIKSSSARGRCWIVLWRHGRTRAMQPPATARSATARVLRPPRKTTAAKRQSITKAHARPGHAAVSRYCRHRVVVVVVRHADYSSLALTVTPPLPLPPGAAVVAIRWSPSLSPSTHG